MKTNACLVGLASLLFATSAPALTVTAPAGTSVVAAGDDYATDVIGDAWDMNNARDIDTDESSNLAAQTFSGGLFTATASTCSSGTANVYPLFQGYGKQTVAIDRGPRFPVNTAKYRYLTVKIMTDTAQQARFVFLQDGDSYSTQTFGSSFYKPLAANAWTILTWDLNVDAFSTPPNKLWQNLPHVQGLRLDPCNTGASTILKVDWLRLTATPVAAQMFNVTWSDTTSGSYTITAIDSGGIRYTFASGVGGTSYAADFSRLAPGDYHVEVSRSGATATSAGVVRVNTPAQVAITAPTQRGEQTLSYAVQEQGGQWGPMSAADFTPSPPPNFTMVSYTNPVGSFYGRPTNGDPNFIMKTTGHLIDASYYRSVCFTQDVFGPRSVGTGSVARLFWGVNSTSVTTTTDIVLGNGLVEYCIPNLADATAVPLVPGSPQPWAGNLGYFRLDPDELTPPGGCSTPQACHDVRLDSIILAPFAEANPSYTIRWNITDPDYTGGGSVQILLDPDKTYGNANEIHLATVAYATGASQYTFTPSSSGAPNGTFNVIVLANDGSNVVPQYAGGPLVVVSDLIFRDGFEGP
jgi:hypothetical protein